MTEDKIKDLEKTNTTWIALCLGDLPLKLCNDMVLPDVMGYGTTLNECVTNLEEFIRLIKTGIEQRKQLKDFSYVIKPIIKKAIGDDNAMLVVDEIKLTYLLDGNKKTLDLRLSTVYVNKSSTWKVIHWHGSLGMDEEDGTWHQEEWKRENEKLQKKVDEQTEELKQSFEDLKATQSQLIHAEKMASLGELTAGIAHEIQNPLNFVNNFSEVSNELIDEMYEEIENGDYAEVKAIAKDLKSNLEKITHHGKRADGIVKGMLQHSRSGSGEKELVNLNKLADEYFRLAYHGLRAKEKSFNAQLETDFDESMEPIYIIPQDIGRVILNVFTNAFYAVSEKKSITLQKDYEPTVSLKTKKVNDTIEITVTDNGNGIPKSVVNKIFEPFYTTKPTGKGTGLGLSMSYDIIRAHNGELVVATEIGKFTEFKIILPIKTKKS
jgi:signal transduction histidine kinase